MPCTCGTADDKAAKDAQAKSTPPKPTEEGAAFVPKFLELTPPLAKPTPAATPAPAEKPAPPQEPVAPEKPVALRESMTPDDFKDGPRVRVRELPAADAKDGGDADKIPRHVRKMMQEREEGLAAAKAHLAHLQENFYSADWHPGYF